MRRALWIACVISCGAPPAPVSSPREPSPPSEPPDERPDEPPSEPSPQVAAMELAGLVHQDRSQLAACYAAAVAANPALAGRGVELSIVASFDRGAFASLVLSPALGEDFEGCVRAVAARWTLAVTQPIAVQASIPLAAP